jgi:hypothetical protein
MHAGPTSRLKASAYRRAVAAAAVSLASTPADAAAARSSVNAARSSQILMRSGNASMMPRPPGGSRPAESSTVARCVSKSGARHSASSRGSRPSSDPRAEQKRRMLFVGGAAALKKGPLEAPLPRAPPPPRAPPLPPRPPPPPLPPPPPPRLAAGLEGAA